MDPAEDSEIVRRLRPLADALDADAGLDELAFAVSAVLQPSLDLIGSLALLDELAGDCPTPTRDGVIDHLFGSGMFGPDERDYHSWENSCLDRVLVRRVGMPITLSIVAIEVARRVGVRLAGVGLPAHFVVGDRDDGNWFADPFRGRSGLSADDCRTLAHELGVTNWSSTFLHPVPDRLVIARVLNNLRVTCTKRHDHVRLALVMQARQLFPEFAQEQASATESLAVFN